MPPRRRRPIPAAADQTADFLLIDGATIAIRPVRPDDEAGLSALIDGLSERSSFLRFFSGAVNARAAARLAATGPDTAGVVAVTGDPETIIGHALYVREGGGRAEVAFEVADAWHGRGVGTILLGAAADRAAAEGIETFDALVMPENHAMVQLFRDERVSGRGPRPPGRAERGAAHGPEPGGVAPLRGA